jgi:hypothetical protein
MILAALLLALVQDGNRLTYLDEGDPYYVHAKFPKLITPQWVGEAGVEAVVTLGIDDMRGHEKWEAFLRPIIDRLKKIDGRASVSIMTCTIDPNHAHLQKWLKEGLSIEVHTVDHPCPLLKEGDFAKSKSTVDRCIDLLNLIPNNKPVAYRMPCCDSLNTPSPRFYAEIFNKVTPGGKFLTIDTSVFNITTSADPDLPKELTTDPDGKERFRKYVPFPSFVNTIENYPYPYVIGGLCWEFPCAVPSDWEAQHLNKPNSPKSVEDIKAAIDAVVIKKGVFNFVFHPHNWIKSEQVVDIIDHVVAKHGSKVKFLTFREAQERLDKTFGPLRKPDGSDNGVRILDLDGNGFIDGVKLGERSIETIIFGSEGMSIKKAQNDLPINPLGGRFGILSRSRDATLFCKEGAWTYGLGAFEAFPELGFLKDTVILRDLDGDGTCEQIAESAIYKLDRGSWVQLPIELPIYRLDVKGRDNGVRFVDLNGDGNADIVASNARVWGVWLFKDLKTGWEKVSSGYRGDPGELPLLTRNGANNGAWFHSRHLWVQNEDTAKMKDLVDRRSFEELLQKK